MKLSQVKKDKISEQILSHLYHLYPQSRFTAEIARELARDEEFIKALMLELQKKSLVTAIKKNPAGIDYERRIKWRLSNNSYSAYKSL